MAINNQIKFQQFADYINKANIICFYGGAGTSTESGIPDYRSQYGIWTQMEEKNQNPQYFANYQRLVEDPIEFFKVREGREKRPMPKPNDTHYVLANLEKKGVDIRVITQNVDGLHQRAGHRFVIELHGDNRTWRCMSCGREYKFNEVQRDRDNVPRCYVDKGVVRPNVVFFGESIDRSVIEKSRQTIEASDLLIIAGTTLATGMAKRLVRDYKGGPIIVINTNEVDLDPLIANLFIQDQIGNVMKAVEPLIKV